MEKHTTSPALSPDKTFDLHIDGSFYHTYNIASGGGCLLEEDTLLSSFVAFVPENIPFNYHEYFALSHSLSNCLSLGVKKLSVQTDCLALVRDLEKIKKKKFVTPRNLNVIKDLNVLPMISQLESFEIKHVGRLQNKMADHLVGSFIEKHILENQLNPIEIEPKKMYSNDSMFFHSPEITVSQDKLESIKDQVVVHIMSNNINEVRVKFIHYSSPDIESLVREHEITLPTKRWGNNVANEFCSFLDSLGVREFRASTSGEWKESTHNYLRPHSEILNPAISDKLNSQYEKFSLISFSPNTEFTNQIDKLFNHESRTYKSKANTNAKPCLVPMSDELKKHKKFLLLALKAIGLDESVAKSFVQENKDNRDIKKIHDQPLEVIQKKLFESFVDNIQKINLSSYLLRKERIKKSGIHLRF